MCDLGVDWLWGMLEMGCQASDLGCWPQPKWNSWFKGVNVFTSLDSGRGAKGSAMSTNSPRKHSS